MDTGDILTIIFGSAGLVGGILAFVFRGGKKAAEYEAAREAMKADISRVTSGQDEHVKADAGKFTDVFRRLGAVEEKATTAVTTIQSQQQALDGLGSAIDGLDQELRAAKTVLDKLGEGVRQAIKAFEKAESRVTELALDGRTSVTNIKHLEDEVLRLRNRLDAVVADLSEVKAAQRAESVVRNRTESINKPQGG